MNLHGVKYAVDVVNDYQYVLVFTGDNLTDVRAYDKTGEEIFIKSQSRQMMFDELIDGNRLVLQMTFGPNRRISSAVVSDSIPGTDPAASLPPQHAQGAVIAREKGEFLENRFNDRLRDPLQELRDLFGAGKDESDPFDDPFTRQPRREEPRQPRRFPGANENPANPPFQRPGTPSGPGSRPVPPRPSSANLSVPDKQLEGLLTKYGKDLTDLAKNGKLDPVIGREEERKNIKEYLLRKKKSSVNLVGESGTGKTDMFRAIAQDIADGNVPEDLKDARVISLDIAGMNEGAKFRGVFEEKLLPVFRGLQERGGYLNGQKVILAIDEIHTAFATGAAEGAANAGQLMLPYLSDEGITVIAATTPDMYKKHIEGKALDRRFQKLIIDSLEDKATKTVLKGLSEIYKKHHRLEKPLTDEQIDYIVGSTNRFMPARKQPDKAIGVMDAASAKARAKGLKEVGHLEIAEAVAAESNLPVSFLTQSDHERMLTLEKELPNSVLDQAPAAEALVNAIVTSRAGLNDPNKPIGAFLFQGPTGVGKTEMAKALAKFLFGTEDALVKFDMGEYAQEHTVSRLLGAPPSFVGFEDTDAQLTEQVRNKPYSVVLFDEVEKAHPKVFDPLLAILNDGKIKDNKGRIASFENTVVIMTTNLGASEVVNKLKGGSGMGFSKTKSGSTEEDVKKQNTELDAIYKKAREQAFRPEFLNRLEELGGSVIFNPLEKSTIDQLIHREIESVSKRLRDNPKGLMLKNVTLDATEEVKVALAGKGYNKAFGARPLKAAVQKYFAQPLAMYLMENKEEILKKPAVKITVTSVDFDRPRNIKMTVEDAVPVATEPTAQQAAANSNEPATTEPVKVKKPASGGPKI